jgi:ketosteroid isomerase-like protein
MPRENVEMVRRAFEAFNRGDLDSAVADIAPDCEYIPSGGIPDADDVYRGPEGYKRFIRWLRDEFDDARVEAHEFIETDDQVVVSLTNRGRGRQSGVEVSWHVWQVWAIRDAKVVRGQGFMSRAEALEAAGLSE